MEKRQVGRFIPLHGALHFIDRNGHRFPRLLEIEALGAMRRIAAEIDRLAQTQANAKSEGPALTELLHDRRDAIMENFVNQYIGTVEYARDHRLPGDWRIVTKPNPKVALHTFITELRVLSGYVKEREAQFAPWTNIKVADFDRAIDELEGTQDDKWRVAGESAGATGALPVLLAKGRELIDLFEDLMGPEVNFDAGLMAEWEAATKVRRVPKKAKAAEKTAETVTTEQTVEEVAQLPATTTPENQLLPVVVPPESALSKIVQPVRRAIRATATLSLPSGDTEAQSFASRLKARLQSLISLARLPDQNQQ